MTVLVISKTVYQLIGNALGRDPSAKHQCFRVKNLLADEIVEVIRLWEALPGDSSLRSVRLLVSEDLGGRIPGRYVAEAGTSITYYRNRNEGGLVYLETQVQSDEQGLQNLFSLRDSNFLDGSFNEYSGYGRGVPELMLVAAWDANASDPPSRIPPLLVERVLEVIAQLHPAVQSVPARHFASFVEMVCQRWRADPHAKDGQVADVLIGECLNALELFPDPHWRAGGTPARIRRRLELNARHSELMSGTGELDPDELQERALIARFLDDDGEELSLAENKRYVDLCRRYVASPIASIRQEIPYAIFEQLFKKDASGLRLGERVRAEIEAVAPERLQELDSLDVVGGLNLKQPAEAERFLSSPVADGLKPLAEHLTNRTRKSVERVATPPASTFKNPLLHLVRVLRQWQPQGESSSAVTKLVVEGKFEPDDPMLGLFSFLFGPALKALSEQTRESLSGCELAIDPSLTKNFPVPQLISDISSADDSDEESRDLIAWEDLSLSLTFSAFDAEGQLIESSEDVQWRPDSIEHLALFWFLACAEDSPAWSRVGDLELPLDEVDSDWLTALVQRTHGLDTFRHGSAALSPEEHPMAREIFEIRESFRLAVREGGLAAEAINNFYDQWMVLLGRMRVEHVPDGSRPRILEAFLGSDHLSFEGDARRMMLPTHPLRLRWIASYLQRCERLALECFHGRATFATGDGEQYLDWLESLTPHETPPTAMGRAGEILYARSESAWFEDYAPLVNVTGDLSVDQSALQAIGKRIQDYIQAHPFKRDGLSVLILLPPSDLMPAQLVDLVCRGANAELRFVLTVAAPKNRWEKIARAVESLPGEERKTGRGRLFPARDLSFIEYDQGGDLESNIAASTFDIALVTHLLQEGVVSQQNTEPVMEGVGGSFNPVLDRPVWLESSGEGGSISIIMRPRTSDTALDNWGTLVVRANRSRPVSQTQPDNVDFVELRVNFQDSARVFNSLHKSSHWVITLERHISREQIESVEAGAPDVLSIEAGVGSNGLNTLIVSSQSGRALIEARLAKKLRKLTGGGSCQIDGHLLLAKLPAQIYDETRTLCPRLALQAMGVARVTEEILGLCVARRLVDEEHAAALDEGLIAWISLDEHSGWFVGPSNIRADMCRILIRTCPDDTLEVELLVLEGKFRQNFDPHGVVQVERTMEFLRSVLGGEMDDGVRNIDGVVWRQRVLEAIDSVADGAIRVVKAGATAQGKDERAIPQRMRELFREGRYRLRAVHGLYSICLWENHDPVRTREQKGEVLIIRSTRSHVLDLVNRPDKSMEVTQIVSGSEEAPDPLPSATVAKLAMSKDQDIEPLELDKPLEAAEVAPEGTLSSDQSVSSPVGRRGMSDEALRLMYDEVLGCFASHGVGAYGVDANEQPYIEGPASVMFKVRAAAGVDPRKLFEKSQALKLGLGLDQEQNVTFDIDRGYVTIDVPKRSELRYFVNAADMWRDWKRPDNQLIVPIGEDRFGNLVTINFSSPNSPHLLIAGTTGSGKSEALNTMLFGLVKYYGADELRLMLVDPKGTELTPFEAAPHLIDSIGWDDADALALLKSAVDEMQRRYALFKERKGCRNLAEFNAVEAQENRMPWWLLVLDEYADLTHDPQAKKEIEQELKRLAQKARAAGIHVVIATQKPSADVISTNLRSNLPAQLALRVKSGTESRVVLDEAGAENLNGKGDALLKADGKLVRVQCGRVDVRDQLIV